MSALQFLRLVRFFAAIPFPAVRGGVGEPLPTHRAGLHEPLHAVLPGAAGAVGNAEPEVRSRNEGRSPKRIGRKEPKDLKEQSAPFSLHCTPSDRTTHFREDSWPQMTQIARIERKSMLAALHLCHP